MGKVKRSGGKGFGKPPKPPDLDSSFDFEELVNGNQILVANVITNEIKGIGDAFTFIKYNDLTNESSDFRSVIATAFDSSLIKLAKRRRIEEGKGLLTLTPKRYRQEWGLSDNSDGEIVFNWWTLPELKVAQERSYIFGGTRILARLTEPLIMHSQDRFPVICHAVPRTSGSDKVNYMHLMFTVPLSSSEAAKIRSINIIERETTPLTELLPPSS
ncbi:hypothetical protein NIES25_67220 (plasmid) [Nostoc linckia NIES-25]|nr:hypothetical protein NIES25_67220 [Nostoc linckia NIES-25]